MITKLRFDELVANFEKFKTDHPELYNVVCNGAGPAKAGKAVRDTLLFKYSTTSSANIHDYLYSKYNSTGCSREEADLVFLISMNKFLQQQSSLSKFMNLPLIYAYFLSVKFFGFLFWEKKS